MVWMRGFVHGVDEGVVHGVDEGFVHGVDEGLFMVWMRVLNKAASPALHHHTGAIRLKESVEEGLVVGANVIRGERQHGFHKVVVEGVPLARLPALSFQTMQFGLAPH